MFLSKSVKKKIDVSKTITKLNLIIILLKFKNMYNKKVSNKENTGPLLPVEKAKIKKNKIKMYLYKFLKLLGNKKSVIIPKPIHLANTIGPPPRVAVLPSILSELNNPKVLNIANRNVTANKMYIVFVTYFTL